MDKCYRLHVFPPGFKFTKSKSLPHCYKSSHWRQFNKKKTKISFLLNSWELLKAQYDKLLNLLQNHSNNSEEHKINNVKFFYDKQEHAMSDLSGIIQQLSIASAPLAFSNSIRIIDSGATDHMVNSPTLLSRITSTKSSFVKLRGNHFKHS